MSDHVFNAVMSFVLGISLGIRVTIFFWDMSLNRRPEPPRDCGGLLWYDYDNNVWTNAAGWYCAIGGQCPDSSPDEGDTGKKEDGK